MNNLPHPRVLIAVGVGVLFIVLYVVFASGSKPALPDPVRLTVWGTENAGIFDKFRSAYAAVRPNVTITYRAIDPKNYDEALTNALAAGLGPDVFQIQNHALTRNLNRLAAAPQNQVTVAQLQNYFPDVIASDFVRTNASGSHIYGAPLYLDTLALFYNKRMFNEAAIVAPPASWDDFVKNVAVLRALGTSGELVRSAAALGGTEASVPYATDLLSLLMMQNGASMNDPRTGLAAFAGPAASGRARQALNFYLGFGNPNSASYTWNEAQGNALDAFAREKTAMFFGYHATLAAIRAKNPFLNVGIAPMPQVAGGNIQNYADYAGFVVSRQSRVPQWAWDFIMRTTTSDAAEREYLAATDRPPALKSLIEEKKDDGEFGVFARQGLTAVSWKQPDERSVRSILNTAIQRAMSGEADTTRALQEAQDQINQIHSVE